MSAELALPREFAFAFWRDKCDPNFEHKRHVYIYKTRYFK